MYIETSAVNYTLPIKKKEIGWPSDQGQELWDIFSDRDSYITWAAHGILRVILLEIIQKDSKLSALVNDLGIDLKACATLPDEDEWSNIDSYIQREFARSLRVGKTNKSFKISVPIGDNIKQMFMSITGNPMNSWLTKNAANRDWDKAQEFLETLYRKMAQILGSDFLDMSKPIDVILPITGDEIDNPLFDVDSLSEYADIDYFKNMASLFRSFRITATPVNKTALSGYSAEREYVKIDVSDGDPYVITTATSIVEMAGNKYVTYSDDESEIDKSIELDKVHPVKEGAVIKKGTKIKIPNPNFKSKYEFATRLDQITDEQDRNRFIMQLAKINRNYTVFLDIEIPPEQISYIAQKEKVEDVTLQDIGTFAFAIAATPGANVHANNSFERIRELNKSVKAVPRTDDNDIVVNREGRLLFIPTVDNIEAFNLDYADTTTTIDGEFTKHDVKFLNKGSKPIGLTEEQELAYDEANTRAKRVAANTLIYTDWAMDYLSYSNSYGTITSMSLAAMSKPSAFNYMSALNYSTALSEEGSLVYSMFNFMESILKAQNKKASSFFRVSDVIPFLSPDIKPIFDKYKDLTLETSLNIDSDLLPRQWQFLVGCLDDIADSGTVRNVFDEVKYITRILDSRSENLGLSNEQGILASDINTGVRLQHCGSKSKYPLLRFLGRISDFIYETYKNKPDGLFKGTGISNTSVCYPIIVALTKYSEESAYSELAAKDLDERAIYLGGIEADPNYTPAPLMNAGNGKMLQPHQVKNDYRLSKFPKFAILDVRAGGGKTIQVITDIQRHIQEGLAKRCLVICPKSLAKNYVEDAAFFANGKLNVVVVNTDTIKSNLDMIESALANPPPNTFFVTDWKWLSLGREQAVYGTTLIDIYSNCEFLRQYGFDYVAIDESHQLSNEESTYSTATARLLSEVPIRRLATGTFIDKDLTNVISQFSFLNSSVFGSREEFINKFADDSAGGKALGWKPGAQAEIKKLLSDHCMFITTERKEWAALLPQRLEEFHEVNLTENQAQAYHALYELELKAIEEKLKSDPKLAAKYEKLKADDEAGLDVDYEHAVNGLLKMPQTMLSMFTSNPTKFTEQARIDDNPEYQKIIATLEGEDTVSPKVKKIVEIINKHFSGWEDDDGFGNVVKFPAQEGKIVIFCTYHNSVDGIYKNLPPEIKKMTLKYEATKKEEMINSFADDPKIKILIGTEGTLNTGLNLQMASRLIRLEPVWKPGDLEQGESRFNRPDPKGKFKDRKFVFYDWVLCNNTIDITKTARLLSRVADVTAFYQQDNKYFADILSNEPLPLVSMSMDNVMNTNSIEQLLPYIQGHQNIRRAELIEYRDYKAEQLKHGTHEPKLVPEAPTPKGSKLISVPFIPNHALNQDFLDANKMVSIGDYADDKDTDLASLDLTGMSVYTAYGDGVVKTTRDKSVRVEFIQTVKGKKKTVSISCPKLSVFVKLNPKLDVTKELTKFTNLKFDRIDSVDSPEDDMDQAPKPKGKPDSDTTNPVEDKKGDKRKKYTLDIPTDNEEADNQITGVISNVNGMYALFIDAEDPDAVYADLAKAGIKETGPFMWAHIPTYRALSNLLDKIEEKYEVPVPYWNGLIDVLDSFSGGKRRLLNVEAVPYADVRNFYLQAKRTVPKGTLQPFPVVLDGELFIYIRIDKQPSAATVPSKLRVPAVKWERGEGEWFFISNKKTDIKAMVKTIEDTGLSFSNKDDLIEMYNSFKQKGRKKDK